MENRKSIFLAGPIRGLSRDQSLGWRKMAVGLLGDIFVVTHALRGREEKETLPDPRLVVARDKSDIEKSAIILVNDTFHSASMIGTAMEILYAFERGKIIIIFGNGHREDYWLNTHSHIRCDTLKDACILIREHF